MSCSPRQPQRRFWQLSLLHVYHGNKTDAMLTSQTLLGQQIALPELKFNEGNYLYHVIVGIVLILPITPDRKKLPRKKAQQTFIEFFSQKINSSLQLHCISELKTTNKKQKWYWIFIILRNKRKKPSLKC